MNKPEIASHIATLANLYQTTKTEAERQAIAERLLEESTRLTQPSDPISILAQ